MDIWYPCFMQKPFVTQAKLFVSSSDLEHPALHALDATEAVLDWSKIEPILSSIYASQTDRPSYPLLTLFRGLLLGFDIGYRMFNYRNGFIVTCCFVSFAILNWGVMFLKHQHWDGFAINWLNTICGNAFWERSTTSLKPRASF